MKRSAKERQRRTRQMRQPWEPFELAAGSDSGETEVDQSLKDIAAALEYSDDAVYINNRYQVAVNSADDQHGFPGLTGVKWLSIKARDGSAIHDWRDYQRIKNELLGPEWEAMEIYPAESRLIDTCNQFHLWCFPPNMRIPIGWNNRLVVEENSTEHGSQRPWEKDNRPDDLLTEAESIALAKEQLA